MKAEGLDSLHFVKVAGRDAIQIVNGRGILSKSEYSLWCDWRYFGKAVLEEGVLFLVKVEEKECGTDTSE